MPFKVMLQDLVQQTAGATGAILTDWEGEAVECYSTATDDYDLKILGAHQNIILNRLREMQQSMASQVVKEAVITTDLRYLLIGAIGSDYMLVLTLERNALVGRALVNVQHTVRLLEKEIY